MNAAIRGVVRQADALNINVYGIWRGFQGLVEQGWRPLTSRNCANILQRGGTILNTARCDAWKLPAVRAQAARDLRDAGVDALVVIGGDGSFTGAELLNREHGIPCAGIPGPSTTTCRAPTGPWASIRPSIRLCRPSTESGTPPAPMSVCSWWRSWAAVPA